MESKEKILYFEGLRGIAVLMVVLHHFAAAFYPALIFGADALSHNDFENYIYGTPLNIIFSGNFALTIFFVLSGYFLTYKFVNFNQRIFIVALMVKRYIRLMLPALISISVAYLLLSANLFYNASVLSVNNSSVWFAGFWNFTPDFVRAASEGIFVTSVFIGKFSYNPVLWMMAYELAGSLLIYITLVSFRVLKTKTLVYILLLLITWKTYLLGFVLGSLICHFEHRLNFKTSRLRKKILLIIVLILFILFGSFPIASTTDTIYHYLLLSFLSESGNMVFYHTIAAFLVLIFIKETKIIKRILENFILRFLGAISFAIYLLHFIIIGSISSYLVKILTNYLSYNQSVFLTFLLTIPIILIISFYFNKYVNLHSIKLAENFGQYIKSKISF